MCFNRLFDGCMEKNRSDKELCEKNAVRSAGGDVMKARGIRAKRFASSRRTNLGLAKKLSNRRRSHWNKKSWLNKKKTNSFWGKKRNPLSNKKRKSLWNKRRIRKKKNDLPLRKIRWGKKWEDQVGAALKKSLYLVRVLRRQSRMLDDIVSELRRVRGIVSSPRRGPVKYRLTYSFVLPKKDSQVLFTLLHWQAINKGAKDIYSLADKHKKLLTKHGKLENESVFHFLKRKNVEMAFRSPFTRKVHEIYKKITKKGRTGWFLTKYLRKSDAKYKLRNALKKLNQYTKTRYHQVKKMLLRKFP